MKNFYSFFISLIILIILFCFICIICFYYEKDSTESNTITNNNYFFSNSEFFWPVPGYHTITSYFGKRVSPTTGASSNHSGVDIAANEGTTIFSILSGKVTFTGFYGANGHTIIIQSNEFDIQYSHLSTNYIINIGDFIGQGEQIGFVGPKYIDDVLNNPYKDSSGKTTNGATTGPHLHLTIKENGVPVNPLNFF